MMHLVNIRTPVCNLMQSPTDTTYTQSSQSLTFNKWFVQQGGVHEVSGLAGCAKVACYAQQPAHIAQYSSRFLNVATILLFCSFSNHIDFSIKPSPSKNSQPLCSASLVDGSTVLRRIRSLQMMNTLKDHYGPESGLTETLQTMGGLSTVSESIPVIGARLSHALRQVITLSKTYLY